ncbi:tetratricopeptide repeat protein [Marinomonas sp. 2405UD66-6]|uniref:tetratricopeptide repeat protein n=1 Tax=Marinomonas sp. 2405UD66-6 TaxID=3391834 RepID=UPI0039C97C78
MSKLVALLFLILTITGCTTHYSAPTVSSGKADEKVMSEKILIKSLNYARLIELYKEQLKEKENSETRLKLANVYIDSYDNESALFTLAPLINQKKINPEVFYAQAVAQYNMGDIVSAHDSLLIVLEREPDNAKALNMLGIIYAYQGELENARKTFNKARELMYSDATIKNNLALLDLIEGEYQSAAATLLPVYLNNRGKVDESVRANLAIIMAKLGSFDYINTLYADKYSSEELLAIYNDLKASELVVHNVADDGMQNAITKTAENSHSISEKVSRDATVNDNTTFNQSLPFIDYPFMESSSRTSIDVSDTVNVQTAPLILQTGELQLESDDE